MRNCQKFTIASPTVTGIQRQISKTPRTWVNFRRGWRQFYVLEMTIPLRRRNDLRVKMFELHQFRNSHICGAQVRGEFSSHELMMCCNKRIPKARPNRIAADPLHPQLPCPAIYNAKRHFSTLWYVNHSSTIAPLPVTLMKQYANRSLRQGFGGKVLRQ